MNRTASGHPLALLWAAPCSAVGLLAAALVLAAGGSARRVGPTLEVALAQRRNARSARWRFQAITLGHVIVGTSHATLAALRAHERVHVRQYELLGPLFFVAYPAASLWAGLHGRGVYQGNWFECQACRGADAADAERNA